MKSAIIARSVVVNGHKTSVTLEKPFWDECRRIADSIGLTLDEFFSMIDAERAHGNLASAIRLYVLAEVRNAARKAGRRGPGSSH
jgi:predicted DNA-binding ribbon-helix-helix protein